MREIQYLNISQCKYKALITCSLPKDVFKYISNLKFPNRLFSKQIDHGLIIKWSTSPSMNLKQGVNLTQGDCDQRP